MQENVRTKQNYIRRKRGNFQTKQENFRTQQGFVRTFKDKSGMNWYKKGQCQDTQEQTNTDQNDMDSVWTEAAHCWHQI